MRLSEILDEGVMRYAHTPKNLAGIAKKGAKKFEPKQPASAGYLQTPRHKPDLIQAPPTETERRHEKEKEHEYLGKFGPVQVEPKHDHGYDADGNPFEPEDDDDFIVQGEEYDIRDADDELNEPGNYDFPANSEQREMPVGRIIAKNENGRYVVVKYVDYFGETSDPDEITYAVVPANKIKTIRKNVVGIPEGGNDFDAYVTMKHGEIINKEFYVKPAYDLLRKVYERGLVR